MWFSYFRVGLTYVTIGVAAAVFFFFIVKKGPGEAVGGTHRRPGRIIPWRADPSALLARYR